MLCLIPAHFIFSSLLCIWIPFSSLGTFLFSRNEDILSSTSNTLLSKQPLWKKCFICASGILLSLVVGLTAEKHKMRASARLVIKTTNLLLDDHIVFVLVIIERSVWGKKITKLKENKIRVFLLKCTCKQCKQFGCIAFSVPQLLP